VGELLNIIAAPSGLTGRNGSIDYETLIDLPDAIQARHILAGPAAECVVSDREMELVDCGLDGDMTDLKTYLPDATEQEILAYWYDSVRFVTEPHVWRGIVRVASELLKVGTLNEYELEDLLAERQSDRQAIPELIERRAKLLATEPYIEW
jgi:hypothetical protein